MSEQSIYCYACGRWWRPAHIVIVNKRKRAPDGVSLSGYCRACKLESARKHHARLKQDPERVAARKARQHESYVRRYGAMTVEERREALRRARANRDRSKDRERCRRYRQAHRAEIVAKNVERLKAIRRDPERRPALLAREQRARERRKARRFAARLASARGGGA